MDQKIEELKKKWDLFSPVWQELFEPLTMTSAFSMLTHINIHKADDVLEVGCGSGGAASLAIQFMKSGSTIHLTDISSQMIQLAQNRCSDNSKGVQVKCQVANCESLPFQDKSFDRVYGNYILHLTFDPKKALEESKRVLKDGGIAAFCVWGRIENSPKFSILSDARKELEMERYDRPFHLSDLESTRKMFFEAGFKKVLAWYQIEATNDSDAETFVQNMIYKTPSTAAEIAKLDETKRKQFENSVREGAQKVLDSGRPLHNEALIVVGYL
eukprot:TRINITY_DN5950_c0_g1_i1.p2 TRINITY_DN5950_c0_g1~~TRINITY_DN5950_c0_g1_i1.p2  ORF type:complete len:271 (-),score=83.93 TRINITY_DN5950_c0_g1_i1:1410-2222(-)